jgi:hypothetical protein
MAYQAQEHERGDFEMGPLWCGSMLEPFHILQPQLMAFPTENDQIHQ